METPQNPTSDSPAPATATPVRPTILLIEDDKASADLMSHLLHHYECEVKVAHTLLEAMPLLPLAPSPVVDLMLPDGGGDRVLELIRRRNLPTKVIVMTGCRDRDRLRDVVRLKPELILAKPLDFFRLLEFIRANP